uniref:Methyltransferase domain-containing protein n=1 Tax=Roseihalotalea indica TaxID=2867963 RepID=A0AA49GT02_9BACT|nr:methyltransferase domain-containing protein [Tunicatimonas sp. TK19036]
MTYHWDADLYQQKYSFVYQYGAGLIEWLAPQPTERILDVGCGTGELTEQIRQSGAEVVGIDHSAEMIRQAQHQYPNVSFSVMDAAQMDSLPQFDAIFSNAALHWMLDAEAVVHQLYQHVKPGGRLVAELGGKGNIHQIISALNQQRTQAGYPFIEVGAQWYFPSVGEYSSLLEKAGFQVQLAQHYDRSTPLSDPENGVKDWIQMFGQTWLKDVANEHREPLLQSVQKSLYSTLFHDGIWYADYKRLRVIARKL